MMMVQIMAVCRLMNEQAAAIDRETVAQIAAAFRTGGHVTQKGHMTIHIQHSRNQIIPFFFTTETQRTQRSTAATR